MPCAKGMGGCHARCLHRASVQAYRDWRQCWEDQRDAVCHGWATEEAEFAEERPPPTFKVWLEQSAGATSLEAEEVA